MGIGSRFSALSRADLFALAFRLFSLRSLCPRPFAFQLQRDTFRGFRAWQARKTIVVKVLAGKGGRACYGKIATVLRDPSIDASDTEMDRVTQMLKVTGTGFNPGIRPVVDFEPPLDSTNLYHVRNDARVCRFSDGPILLCVQATFKVVHCFTVSLSSSYLSADVFAPKYVLLHDRRFHGLGAVDSHLSSPLSFAD